MLPNRFMTKIDKQEDCWIWTAAANNMGYGVVNMYPLGNKLAHRAVYELLKGKIPEGLVLDHLCKTPRCVNPEHLEPVTQKENMYRGDSPRIKRFFATHCVRGHEFTEENSYRQPSKPAHYRQCRKCNKLRWKEYYKTAKSK